MYRCCEWRDAEFQEIIWSPQKDQMENQELVII